MKEKTMKECLEYVLNKSKKEELPIGCFIVYKNKIIAKAINNKNIKHNVLGHAEIICIQKASKKLKRWNLNDCEMYVTLKPCPMCETIIKEAHIEKVYYLIDKLSYKKQFQKTKILEINNMSYEKEIYKEKLKEFFENRR